MNSESSQADSHSSNRLADCSACPVRFNAVCSRCCPEELEQLTAIRQSRRFGAGAHIAHAGQKAGHVGTVVSGTACATRSLEDGRRQIVGILLPGDFVGRPGRARSSFDVVAATDVEMCRFPVGEFEKILSASPAISQRLLEMTLDELDAARIWMLVLGRSTARERLACLIAMFVQHDARLRRSRICDPAEFELPLTREAIADYLGLTVETVSRRFTELRRDGVIEFRGRRRITIPRYDELIRETGDSENWRNEFHGGHCPH